MASFIEKFVDLKVKHPLVVGSLLVILLSLPTVRSLFNIGNFKMHDDIQSMRVFQMSKCFLDGQIPCRWVPDMGYGYGYPQFNYYGPLPYYLMTIIHFIGFNFLTVVNIGFIFALILGNLSMFLLGYELWGGLGGIFSAIAYAYSPYRGSDIFSRGAMSESWAFVFLPLIFLFSYRLLHKVTPRVMALLSLSLAGLIFTHNVTTLIAIPFLGAFFMVGLILYRPKHLVKLMSVARSFIIALIWGIASSASFLFGVIFEKSYAHTESMIGGYFDYRAHFVTIYQLFISTFWGTGSSEIGPHDELSFFIGPVLLIFLFISLTLLIIKRKTIKRNQILMFVSLLILGGAAAFMTHEKSSTFWKLIPPLIYLQFPWRFLVMVNFFLAASVGAISLSLVRSSRFTIPAIFLLATVFFNQGFLKPSQFFSYSQSEKFSGPSWDKQMTISIFDYLPTAAKFPPNAPAPYLPQIISGNIGIQKYQSGSNWFSFTSESKDGAEVRVPTFCFPGWKLLVDGKSTPFSCATELGLVQFKLPAGTHTVALKLGESPIRLIGDALTLIFLPLSLFVIIKNQHETVKQA